jgi:hypothetical protein
LQPQYDFILGNPFDTAESMAEALRLLLSFGTPIRLNTYKMQYFPHYPFTNMALEAGYITKDEVSDEGIARQTMYDFAYRPKFPAPNRRDYLENCIYLLPWTSPWVRKLLHRLQERHDPILAAAASLLAKIRYGQVQGEDWVIWPRRIYVAMKLVVRGDFGDLFGRIRKILLNASYARAKTGRMISS